jgi:hypothetical protein
VLYWFRTPPGVKVGRAALDEEAIRLIEQLNPGIEFDWTRILKGQGSPSTEPRPPAEARRQRPDTRRAQPSEAPARAVQAFVPAEPVQSAPAELPPVGTVLAPPDEISALRPDEDDGSPDVKPEVEDAPTPAHAKLGSEGVQRLRARHAEILARISERAADPLRREELKSQADRLNPDAWVTDEEVAQGLEQYESVFASLREVVGQTRRRRRRGRGPRSAETAVGPSVEPPLEQRPALGNTAGSPGPDLGDSPDSGDDDGDSTSDES